MVSLVSISAHPNLELTDFYMMPIWVPNSGASPFFFRSVTSLPGGSRNRLRNHETPT